MRMQNVYPSYPQHSKGGNTRGCTHLKVFQDQLANLFSSKIRQLFILWCIFQIYVVTIVESTIV